VEVVLDRRVALIGRIRRLTQADSFFVGLKHSMSAFPSVADFFG
jgi:hypothetical protein